jgi:threonine/homoserine/homoserine lactone efflux protein
VLNPKPGLFVVAFIPQFTRPSRGSVLVQMLVYGVIFAILTAGICAQLSFGRNRHLDHVESA